MKKSEDRILTTHVGSLSRSELLLAMLSDKETGKDVDAAAFRDQVLVDMSAAVRRQAGTGIDIAGDGEIPRLGFSIYAKDRMTGFDGSSQRGTVTDFARFPEYAALMARRFGVDTITKSATTWDMPKCVRHISYDDTQALQELDLFDQAVETEKSPFTETFVTAASPGILSTTFFRDENHPDYASDAEYIYALAKQLKQEYELIVSRGHILQVDAPDLALERQIMYVDRPVNEFLERVELHIDALNLALTDIPPEKVRMHLCWGNWDGPHCDDIDLEPLLPLLYRARVGGLSVAFANPRHQHEIQLFRKLPPPPDLVFLPGCIDVTNNYLEHPELVAKRIVEFASIIGDRERVIASTDCGFSTFAGYIMVAPDVAWAKLGALVEGASIASATLWGKSV